MSHRAASGFPRAAHRKTPAAFEGVVLQHAFAEAVDGENLRLVKALERKIQLADGARSVAIFFQKSAHDFIARFRSAQLLDRIAQPVADALAQLLRGGL